MQILSGKGAYSSKMSSIGKRLEDGASKNKGNDNW